jgi:hypothetical protein
MRKDDWKHKRVGVGGKKIAKSGHPASKECLFVILGTTTGRIVVSIDVQLRIKIARFIYIILCSNIQLFFRKMVLHFFA